MVTEMRGNYTWNETEADTTAMQPCVYGMVNTSRLCDASLMDWQPSTVLAVCPTIITEMFQTLGNVSIFIVAAVVHFNLV